MIKRFAPLVCVLLVFVDDCSLTAAQQAPLNLRPTRDVVVDIATTRQTAERTERITGRVAWLVAEDLMRIENPGVPGWTLLDRKRGEGAMIMDERRAFMPLPRGIVELMLREIPANAPFTRQGTAVVAGHACVRWLVALPHGDSTVCLTNDGVMLRWTPVRHEADMPGLWLSKVEATAVSYRSQDPARFRVPAGYVAMNIPIPGTPDAGLQPTR